MVLVKDCNDFAAVLLTVISSVVAPIVVYCRSGRRASKAEETLKSKGYKTVLNAGGFDDLGYLSKA